MISVSPNRIFRLFVELVLVVLLTLVLFAALAGAHAQTSHRAGQAPQTLAEKSEQPMLRDYRGVRVGMTATEARAKLGEPADKSDAQDYYSFSDQETAQIFYDGAHTVRAVSVNYLGASAPTAQTVLGVALAPAADGTIYKLVKYPTAGYWVSYSRTAGDAPIVTVVMQRL
jgi:hypothetical protein